MGLLGLFLNSPNLKLCAPVQRVSFPIRPSVSKLPVLRKDSEHFIYSLLPYFQRSQHLHIRENPIFVIREIPKL